MEQGSDIAFSNVKVRGGSTPAQRFMSKHQFLDIGGYIPPAWFLSYYATCNLTATRAILEEANGFLHMRSGGDADFCWRAQTRHHSQVRWSDEVTMEWEPRATSRELLAQWRKYGSSGALLRVWWRAHGATVLPSRSYTYLGARLLFRSMTAFGSSEPRVALLSARAHFAADVAYGRQLRSLVRSADPSQKALALLKDRT